MDGYKLNVNEINGYYVLSRSHWNDSVPEPQFVITEREARQALDRLQSLLEDTGEAP